MATQVAVKWLPPRTDYPYTPPKLDRHQFVKRKFKTTSLAFTDFHDIHLEHRRPTQERRIETPSWASNSEQLREIVLDAVERRAMAADRRLFELASPKDTWERLQHAEAVLKMQIPRIRARMHELILKYKHTLELPLDEVYTRVSFNGNKKALWKVCKKEDRLADLISQIRNQDRQILMLRRGLAATMIGVIYFYYNVGWDSVETAKQLGLTPVGVHQILYQLNHHSASVS